MKWAATVVLSLACAGHSQLQPSAGYMQAPDLVDDSLGNAGDAASFGRLKSFAMFLLALNSASAFNPTSSAAWYRQPCAVHRSLSIAMSEDGHTRRNLLTNTAVLAAAGSASGIAERAIMGSSLIAPAAAKEATKEPAAAAEATEKPAANFKMTQAQIEKAIAGIPAIAVVSEDDQLYFSDGKLGYIYLDPVDAITTLRIVKYRRPGAHLKVVYLSDVYFNLVRANETEINGEVRILPDKRQITIANKRLDKETTGDFLGDFFVQKLELEEKLGQVPLFFSQDVFFNNTDGKITTPLFMTKEDLDDTYEEGVEAGRIPKRKYYKKRVPSEGKEYDEKREGGLTQSYFKVATLDGVVDDMVKGENDLSDIVVVPSKELVKAVQQLEKSTLVTR